MDSEEACARKSTLPEVKIDDYSQRFLAVLIPGSRLVD